MKIIVIHGLFSLTEAHPLEKAFDCDSQKMELSKRKALAKETGKRNV